MVFQDVNIENLYGFFNRYTIHKNTFDNFVQFMYYYHDVDAVFTPWITVHK